MGLDESQGRLWHDPLAEQQTCGVRVTTHHVAHRAGERPQGEDSAGVQRQRQGAGCSVWQRDSAESDGGYLLGLAFFFDRVRAVSLPAGETLAGLARKEFGAERLNDLLVNSRPLMTCRTTGRGFLALQSADPDLPVRGPGFELNSSKS